MDPSDPASYNHRTERLSTGHVYHFVDQAPGDYNLKTTPTLLCIHGFPDFWYGWRHVISPWVQTYGWRVVVPDMLGYGGTDKPADPKFYTTKSLNTDLVALLDMIGVAKAVVIGHDWGAAIAWRFAMWHPDRLQALVTLSIPLALPRSRYLSLEEVVKRMPAFGYQLYFETLSSTKEIEANLPNFFKTIYSTSQKPIDHTNTSQPIDLTRKQSEHGSLLNAKEFDYYLNNFRMGGMNGPLNYYRTTKLRFDEEAAANLALPKSLPVLFIWGDQDPTCTLDQVKRMHTLIPLFEDIRVFRGGHWLAVESKDTVINSVAKLVQTSCQTDFVKPKL